MTNIRRCAFKNCSGLTSVTIPDSVTGIEDYAFDCSSLGEVFCLPQIVPNAETNAFGSFTIIPKTLHVPSTSISKYKSQDPWRRFINIEKIKMPEYTLTYILDGKVFSSYKIEEGATISPEPAPTKEGYTFSGWSEIPETMPAHDVTVTGTFTINKYKLTYMVDGVNYKSSEVEYGAKITPEAAPTKKGYTFSGWSEIPETMPAHDVTVFGTFSINKYTLSISATGNGIATYNSTAVRGKTQAFTVNEGSSATVTFSPDAGHRIASVKLSGTDITSSVSNNQYTISNITTNTTLEVTFEAITHTLSISATGNGSATYNSTAVRGKTQTFTVTEGTSATIRFTPDTGYRIKSVKLNNTDVTSNVANSQYTISNIKSDNTLAVEFETIPPSTYMLNIVAVGNGSVTYNNTTIRNQSKDFTVVEKSAVTITMSPDNGYRIANVKVNSADVTSQVSDGQITISNIMQDTNVEVTFEEIPPTTYSLTITATGNGTVTYDGNNVRGGSSTFTIVEGSYATVQIAADNGYRLKQVTLDGKDVTDDVTDGKYTTTKIVANTTLEVEFVEAVTELAYNGVSYRVVSYDEQTVNVAAGNYGLTLTVPATFEASGKTWTVVGIDSDALANATELAAIIWQPEVAFTAKVNNPNLLLYVTQNQYAPSDIQNVVVGDQAENIVLKEAESGNNFYCPKAFTAKRISYEHHYSMTTGYNTCQGWETIALPFDVTTILNQKGTELVPYTTWQQGSNLRPFWLYQLTESGWQAGNGIKANVPYIISMPNNVLYQSSYNQSGYIQFKGNNVEVKASSQLGEGQYGKRHFFVNYQQQGDISDIYALNVNNQWSSNTDVSQAEGSAFIRNSRAVHPFEAYRTLEGGNAPWMIPVFDNATDVRWLMEDVGGVMSDDAWYDLQGRRLQGEPTKQGIYIYKGKKVRK